MTRFPCAFAPLRLCVEFNGLPAKAALASRRAALGALFTSLLHHLLTVRLRLPEFTK